MNIPSLKNAEWKKQKKVAELWLNNQHILTMEFSGSRATVKFGRRQWEIGQQGFWKPQQIVKENGTVIATQKTVGFWGTRCEVYVHGRMYKAVTRSGMQYNLQYLTANDREVVSYKLNNWKWKPAFNFSINENIADYEDRLLLLVLGYYTARAVMQQSGAAAAIIAAGA